jgi:hypothetical protein
VPILARPRARSFLRRTRCALASCLLVPAIAEAQQADTAKAASAKEGDGTRLGLAATGLVGIAGGPALLAQGNEAIDGAAIIDLGWIGSKRVRLVGDVSFLSALSPTLVEPTGAQRQARFYDFSVATTVEYVFPTAGRLEPYAGAGVAVHALASASGIIDFDLLYNTNLFGVHAVAGVIAALTRDGRIGAQIETRIIGVHRVGRGELRVGLVRYLGDRVRAR